MLALLEPTEILQWLDDFQYLAMFGVLFLCGIGLPIPEEVTLISSESWMPARPLRRFVAYEP